MKQPPWNKIFDGLLDFEDCNKGKIHMDIKEAAMRAYGELWQDLSGSRKANDARKYLKEVLTDAERAQGIQWANEKNGQLTEGEVLTAIDMIFAGEEGPR